MTTKTTKDQKSRKWYTMPELRQLTNSELVDMAINLGGSEEWRNNKQRSDLLAYIMGKQIIMRDQGYEFVKGGQQ